MEPGMEVAAFSSEVARSNAMKCKVLDVLAVLAGCGPALAAQQIAPVQVTGSPEFQLVFDCANPARPSRADVVRLFEVNDTSNTHHLRTQLLIAVGEACVAGIPAIAVTRTVSGERVAWAPLQEPATSVAAN
jgi:hypothetical protein